MTRGRASGETRGGVCGCCFFSGVGGDLRREIGGSGVRERTPREEAPVWRERDAAERRERGERGAREGREIGIACEFFWEFLVSFCWVSASDWRRRKGADGSERVDGLGLGRVNWIGYWVGLRDGNWADLKFRMDWA